MIIDTHHHLWKYNESDYTWMSEEMTSIRRDFLAPDLLEVTHAARISGTVAVQARQSVEETEWLLKLASGCSVIQGVVGWVPLCSSDVEPILERLQCDRKLKGVRHVLHDEPDEDFMLRKDFNRGVGLLKDFNLIYDVLIFERHLPQTIEFIDRHAEQLFVLDHIGKPLIRRGLLAPWSAQIRELAKRENVFCKMSGMVTEADWRNWRAEQLRPYFDVVIDAFGPKRIMFGSDWPVVTLAAGYCEWVDTFRTFLNGLSPCEQKSICFQTAIDVYGLRMEQ